MNKHQRDFIVPATQNADQTAGALSAPSTISNNELMDLESKYCSYGDTVHYMESPKIFERCEGSFLYADRGTP